MKIIDGKKIASNIKAQIKDKVDGLAKKPGLAVILVGEDIGSRIYVKLKERAAREAGIKFQKYFYPITVGQQEILDKIKFLNEQEDIHGILVQLPLPAGLSEDRIISEIIPEKDVDGFHPENIISLKKGNPLITPGLAVGIISLIKRSEVDLKGKQALIVSNSNVFAQPVGILLKKEEVFVQTVLPDDHSLLNWLKRADVLIVAAGRPKFIKEGMLKPGCIVVDVGYNRVNGRAVGDVDLKSVQDIPGWITPVPGGVGPVTVAMLLKNLIRAYEIQEKKKIF